MTTRLIFCEKLKAQAPALDKPPYPGALGQRIFEHISATAWQQWQQHQVMLINEYRLNLLVPALKNPPVLWNRMPIKQTIQIPLDFPLKTSDYYTRVAR